MRFETTKPELQDVTVIEITEDAPDAEDARQISVADERPIIEDPEDKSQPPEEVFSLAEDEEPSAEPPAGNEGGGDSGNGDGGSELPVGGNGEDDEGDDDNERGEAEASSETPVSPGFEVRETRHDFNRDGLRRQDTLAGSVHQLGETVARETVVSGKEAIDVALGRAAESGQLQATVSEGAYRYMREKQDEGWQEEHTSDGRRRLVNGDYEITMELGGNPAHNQSHEAIMGRSWQTEDGVYVANPADMAALWSSRRTEEDLANMDELRKHLLNPDVPPLDLRVSAREAQIIRDHLPPHVRDHPDAQPGIELAGSGLLAVNTLYGSGEIGNVNQISGSLDQTPATYHNAHGVPDGVASLAQHMDNVNEVQKKRELPPVFTPRDYGLGAAAETNADRNYGDGRKKDQSPDNPNGYDEYRSALIIRNHAAYLGVGSEGRLFNVVHGTTFGEGTGEQLGKYSEDPLVQAVAGEDLQPISEKGLNLPLIVEDGFANRWSKARTAGKVAAENNVVITTIDEGYQFFDAYADAKPSDAPDGPTVRGYAVGRLRSNAPFVGWGFKYSPKWTRENKEQRLRNAARYYEAADAYENGIPLQAIARADQEYAAED